MKKGHLHIRLEEDLKTDFFTKCANENLNISRVLRELIKKFVEGRK